MSFVPLALPILIAIVSTMRKQATIPGTVLLDSFDQKGNLRKRQIKLDLEMRVARLQKLNNCVFAGKQKSWEKNEQAEGLNVKYYQDVETLVRNVFG